MWELTVSCVEKNWSRKAPGDLKSSVLNLVEEGGGVCIKTCLPEIRRVFIKQSATTVEKNLNPMEIKKGNTAAIIVIY